MILSAVSLVSVIARRCGRGRGGNEKWAFVLGIADRKWEVKRRV